MSLKHKIRRVQRLVLDVPRIAKIRKFKGIHRGESAVIIGMGPSLRPEDLDRFDGFRTFACNKIYLAFDKTSWRPDYYSICDILVAQNNSEAILNADFQEAVPFHSQTVWPDLSGQKNALRYEYDNVKSIEFWKEGSTATIPAVPEGICSGGYSVLIDQLQIAHYMGFKRVFLVGVDFSFSGGKPTGAQCSSGAVLTSEGEVNHFHPDYRKPGETWTVPEMEKQRHAFSFCKTAFEQSGIELINASRTSILDVLPKIPFDQAFPEA